MHFYCRLIVFKERTNKWCPATVLFSDWDSLLPHFFSNLSFCEFNICLTRDMSRTPVAVSLLLYISLQVRWKKRNENNVHTFHYHHSIESNVVQITFARMNVNSHFALNCKWANLCLCIFSILIREKFLLGKSGAFWLWELWIPG